MTYNDLPIGSQDTGAGDARADRLEVAGLAVRYAGRGRGWLVRRWQGGYGWRTTAGPYTTREAAEREADRQAREVLA